MDQERFDHVARGLPSSKSRRGLLGAGAAFVALLAAKPVAAGKTPNPNPPNNPGNGQNGQPGTGQNGQLGSGPDGQPGPSLECQDRCQEQFDGCAEPCDKSVCLGICQDRRNDCLKACANA